MNKDLVYFAQFNVEEPFYVNYYLVSQPCGDRTVFGVGLEKISGGAGDDEYTYAHDVFTSRDKTLGFLAKLYAYRVTPMTLLDIVDDILAE